MYVLFVHMHIKGMTLKTTARRRNKARLRTVAEWYTRPTCTPARGRMTVDPRPPTMPGRSTLCSVRYNNILFRYTVVGRGRDTVCYSAVCFSGSKTLARVATYLSTTTTNSSITVVASRLYALFSFLTIYIHLPHDTWKYLLHAAPQQQHANVQLELGTAKDKQQVLGASGLGRVGREDSRRRRGAPPYRSHARLRNNDTTSTIYY